MSRNAALRDPATPASGARSWRAVGWVAISLVLFAVLLVSTLMVASRLTIELGIAFPQREHFALVQAVLFGASLLGAVPFAGRVLGQAGSMWLGFGSALPFVLAAIVSYLLFADVRSRHVFETDHALPEVFVPLAIALLGTAQVARRVAATDAGRRAWSWLSGVAGFAVLALVGFTVAEASADRGGMFQLDSPLTFAALAAAATYAIAVVGRLLLASRK